MCPPFAICAVIRHNCIGVVWIYPWPIPVIIVSPNNHPLPKVFFFHWVLGINPSFSISNKLSKTFFPNPKYQFAGKTGTAQVKKITERERELDLKTSEIPYEQRDHALYIAYGPYVNPRYALSIVVEHGGNGSTTAAPMAKKLFKLIIDRHEMRQSINDKKYLEI